MMSNSFEMQANYEKTLRRRRWIFLGLLLIGVTGNICSGLLLQDSGLPDFVMSFYSGGTGGLTGTALVLLLRNQRLLKNPEARKEARIREKDEREKEIAKTAYYFAGLATFYVSTVALFILLPINQTAFWTLVGVGLFYLLSTVAASLWLSKRR